MKKIMFLFSIFFLFLYGCTTATHNTTYTQNKIKEHKLTVGLVQQKIKKGMTQTKVAEILGSPNIVSSENAGEETWIYDRVSSDLTYSTDSNAIQGLVLGMGGNVAGGISTGYSKENGSITRTQKTLTIIIKFKGGKVYDLSYHASRF